MNNINMADIGVCGSSVAMMNCLMRPQVLAATFLTYDPMTKYLELIRRMMRERHQVHAKVQ